ncbi:hypothetical protein F441_05762, partial [Phytophthora nicotianae CJ01A1]
LTPTEAWYRDLLSRVRKGDSEFKKMHMHSYSQL